MIRLSRLTDYAIVLLTQMVREDRAIWAASDLAERTGLPMPTVSKVLKQLAKANVIEAQRGAAGGYRLARAAGGITVAAIIEAMDGPIAITDCVDGGDHSCNVESICAVHSNWNRVNRAVKQALEGVSLAEMAMPAPLPAAENKPAATA